MQLPALDQLNTYFNFKIAKLIATLLVLIFILYHGILHAIDGGDSCYRLLSRGRFQGSNMWQPYGCMMHSYSNEDSRRCMRYVAFLKQKNHIAFVGDSRIRQLYYSLVRQIAVNPPSEEVLPTGKTAYHKDMKYEEKQLRLKLGFYWRPYINETTNDLLQGWKKSSNPPSLVIIGSGLHYIKNFNDSEDALMDYTNNITQLAEEASLLPKTTNILWMLQEPVLPEKLDLQRLHITNRLVDTYNRAAMQAVYRSRIEVWGSARLIAQGSLSDFIDGMHAGEMTVSYYIQVLLNRYCNNYLNFDDGSCCNTREGFTTTQITTFVALCSCSVVMMALSLKKWLSNSSGEGESDSCTTSYSSYANTCGDSDISSSASSHSPLHFKEEIGDNSNGNGSSTKNYYAMNRVDQFENGFNYVKAQDCCSEVHGSPTKRKSDSRYSEVTKDGYTLINNSGNISTSKDNLYNMIEKAEEQNSSTVNIVNKNQTVSYNKPSLQTIFRATGKLGLIMGYFFLCDRTGLFMKENKYFSNMNFWFPLGYMLALGLFFTEDTNHTRLLHRDMTDEWKGWMQLVILVYHMTGGSQQLSIYLHVRILVSAYLFLTGFGHFTYAWAGRDMGLVRYCQVMFRLNFLTVLLCLVMNRPYQFYYYVPLVSFWYTVLYAALALPPVLIKNRANNSPLSNSAPVVNYFYSIMKFIGIGGFVIVLFLSEVFFEKVFVIRPWKALFVTTDDDIHEWWFRWQLDRHSILYGAIFALLYKALCQYGIIDDTSSSNLVSGRLAVFFLSVLSLFSVSSYALLTKLCGNKRDCNQVHPYIVWIPIVGYIVLRNQIGMLRTRYSSFFAWFGKISLELFVCQYHIWLAADTHGVLVLIPSYPVANVLLTSFIFLCVSQEIHEITNVLLPFFVPNNPWRAVRNLSIFLFLLLGLAIHDGIF